MLMFHKNDDQTLRHGRLRREGHSIDHDKSSVLHRFDQREVRLPCLGIETIVTLINS